MSKSEQISDIELNAAVGGRTEVTLAQYEQILAQRIADAKSAQNPPWWKFW
jgi:hypothetical protein